MPLFDPDKADHHWVNEQVPGPEVGKKYDGWAQNYNRDLKNWDYRCPDIVADLMQQHLHNAGPVLDAGCGTGLSGRALQKKDIRPLIGMDVSPTSLDLAKKTRAYAGMVQVDMTCLPLPFASNRFAGLTCVGVLAYLHNTESLLKEFCRIVRPDGIIAFTQREDAFHDRRYPAVLKQMEHEGLWKKQLISDPAPYLPENKKFGESIRVIRSVFRISKFRHSAVCRK